MTSFAHDLYTRMYISMNIIREHSSRNVHESIRILTQPEGLKENKAK